MGEVAAAHVAGALTLDDAARVISTRSVLLRRISGRGAMAMVELSPDDLAPVLRGSENQLSIAVCNSPRSTVVAGDVDALDALIGQLGREGVLCRRVKVDVASHSPQVEPLRDDLLRGLTGLTPVPGRVPMYSTVTGAPIDGCAARRGVLDQEPARDGQVLDGGPASARGRVRCLRRDQPASDPFGRYRAECRRRPFRPAPAVAAPAGARASGHAGIARGALRARLPGGLGAALSGVRYLCRLPSYRGRRAVLSPTSPTLAVGPLGPCGLLVLEHITSSADPSRISFKGGPIRPFSVAHGVPVDDFPCPPGRDRVGPRGG